MAAERSKTAKTSPGKAAKSGRGVKKRIAAKKAKREKQTEDATKPFRFLDLPAEIRNSIYELHLRTEGSIEVDGKLKLPPLLAVCSQIREEACSIWYRDNKFIAPVVLCDATASNKWAAHCCTVGQRDYFDVSTELRGYIRWKNLLQWCEAIWKDDQSRVLVCEDGMRDTERVVCAAHQIALDHKRKRWSACLVVLKDLKREEEAYGNADLFLDHGSVSYSTFISRLPNGYRRSKCERWCGIKIERMHERGV